MEQMIICVRADSLAFGPDMTLAVPGARQATFNGFYKEARSGSAYTPKETRIFAQQLGLKSRFTPVKSPQSNGMSEAFVKTLKRHDVRINPLPNAETVLSLRGDRIEDYNENHPHSGLK